MEDLANRSRRNNLVFLNVPKNSEADHQGICSDLIKHIVTKILKLELNPDTFVIDRAHRTPTHLPNVPRAKPSPIHVCFPSLQRPSICAPCCKKT